MGTKKHLQRLTSETGDTIVEVLLCLTVLGLVIGGASVLAGRNTKNLQTTKENAVALRLAQSQIEYVKSFAAVDWDSLASGNVCMQNSVTQLPSNNAACTYSDSAGAAQYNQNITLTKAADGSYILAKATVTWETLTSSIDPVTGKPKDPGKVEVTYKIYKRDDPAEDRREGGSCGEGKVGTPPNCVAAPPQVRAQVLKIRPTASQTTPSCSSTAYENRSGTSVRLTGGGFNQTLLTNTSSEAVFQDVNKIVPGTNYTATITGVPSGYQVCSGSAQTGTLNATTTIYPVTPQLTIRPICGTETRYTAPYNHYSASYDHYTAPYHHYTAAYDHGYWAAWWDHPGPDRRIGGVGNSTFRQTENGQTVEYRARPDLGGSPMFFERWVWVTAWVSTGYYADYLGYYADYLGYYGDYLGYYGDAYTANVCPS